MQDQPIGLRERKKLATRAALAQAALRLAMEHGVDNFTVEEVTREVGVSPRTFFNYFGTKEEAIVHPSKESAEQIVRALRARPARESLGEALRAAMRETIAAHNDVTKDWAARLRLTRSSPSLLPAQLAVYNVVERTLTEAIAERKGVHPDALYPHLVAAAVISSWRTAGAWWIERGAGDSLADMVDAVIDQLVAGIESPR